MTATVFLVSITAVIFFIGGMREREIIEFMRGFKKPRGFNKHQQIKDNCWFRETYYKNLK